MCSAQVGQRISSNDTRTLKRVFLAGIVLINSGIFVNSIVDGSLLRHPLAQMGAFAILLGIWVLVLKQWKIFGLADVVVDCGDYLSVRKGKVEQNIHFSNIASVSASSTFNVNRIKVVLAMPIEPWRAVEFVPETLSRSKVAEMHDLASALTARAERARAASSNAG
jgi:hypothetical protein